MEDLCTGCLCAGRNLYSIAESGSYQLFTEIIEEMPVFGMSSISVQFCWECHAVLKKFNLFKKQVQTCYSEILDHLHHNISYQSLQKPPHLQIYNLESLNYPEIKTECDLEVGLDTPVDLKSEMGDIKTFVKELPIRKRRRRKELHEKTHKKNSKKKQAKVKKKEKSNSKKRKTEEVSMEIEQSDRLQDENDVDVADDTPDFDDRDEKETENDSSKQEREEDIKVEQPAPVKKVTKRPRKANGEVDKAKPQCVECNKTFASRKTYRFHMNVIHKGQNHYPCVRCGRVYQWKSNLDRHMRSHRARDKGDDFYCAPCDIHFASICTYKQHFKVSKQHAPDRQRHGNYECNECGKKFITKTLLGDHIDWEHLKKIKFRCQLCNNKPFKTQASLKLHEQNKHSKEKGKKGHLCHVCGKSYQFACQLKEHVTGAHTSDTPHRCPLCSAAFGYSTSLYGHIREVHYKIKTKRKRTKKPKKMKDMEPTLQQLVFPNMHTQAGP